MRELGPGVSKVGVGEPVILSWIKGSGANVLATVYRENGRAIDAGGITTFARHTIVSENRLTRLPAEMPLREAALVGCPVPTGVGAVINTAGARPGQSVACSVRVAWVAAPWRARGSRDVIRSLPWT